MYLAFREEGAKGLEGKSSWKNIKSKRSNLKMFHAGILEEAIKGFSARKNRGPIKR